MRRLRALMRWLTAGYRCDGCRRWRRRWRGKAHVRATRWYVRLYCRSCAAGLPERKA